MHWNRWLVLVVTTAVVIATAVHQPPVPAAYKQATPASAPAGMATDTPTDRAAPQLASTVPRWPLALRTAAAANGEGGFTLLPGVTATRVGRVVRMGTDTPAEVRGLVRRVVASINDAAGVGLTVGPDTDGPPATNEIVVRVRDQTACGPLASGCLAYATGPANGHRVVTTALIEIQRELLGSGYELPVLLHEMGHAMGLGHYDQPFGTLMQVMWSFVTPDMVDYRAGDRNGLRALATAFANPRVTGTIDTIRQSPDGIRVVGWTLDPDAPTLALPVTATATIEASTPEPPNPASSASGTADLFRPEIGTVFPNAGPNHGLDLTVPTPAREGRYNVCVTATGNRNQAMGIGCRPLVVNHRPIGAIDTASVPRPGAIRVTGWAIDPDTTDPISVAIDVDGRRQTTVLARRTRQDVGQAHPDYGPDHGFAVTLEGLTGGRRQVCATGIDLTGHANRQLGCRTVNLPGGNPIGRTERLLPRGAFPTAIVGWAIDPDTADPITVRLRVNGTLVGSGTADRRRADIGLAFPRYGERHGYRLELPRRPVGRHRACVVAVNVGSGTGNTRLGCIDYRVPGGVPFGSVDAIRVRDGRRMVEGWAIDPDTPESIRVRMFVNGRFIRAAQADTLRRDVGLAFPGYGDRHGFRVPVTGLRRGVNMVCVTAVNVGTGRGNTLLGCTTVHR